MKGYFFFYESSLKLLRRVTYSGRCKAHIINETSIQRDQEKRI